MASFNKFNPMVESMAEKKFDFGADTHVVALTAAGSAPTSSNAQLSDITPISYTNLSSRTLTTSSSAQSSGTYKLIIADLTLTASGGSVAAFRYIVLYDDTSTNDQLFGYYDYGSGLTMADTETFLIDLDGTNGVFSLA